MGLASLSLVAALAVCAALAFPKNLDLDRTFKQNSPTDIKDSNFQSYRDAFDPNIKGTRELEIRSGKKL